MPKSEAINTTYHTFKKSLNKCILEQKNLQSMYTYTGRWIYTYFDGDVYYGIMKWTGM
jgi:hypothetical protein